MTSTRASSSDAARKVSPSARTIGSTFSRSSYVGRQTTRRTAVSSPHGESPSNAELADRFELLADLLELDGADSFRLAAYRRAATRMRESAAPVAQLALDGRATQIPGIGGTIAAKIVELTETGDLQALAKLRDRVPAGLVDVMRVPGLGPKTARRLFTELGIASEDDLRAAAEKQQLRELSGPRPEDRGAGPRGPVRAEGQARAQDAARPCPSRRRGRRRGAARASGRRARLGGRARSGGASRRFATSI